MWWAERILGGGGFDSVSVSNFIYILGSSAKKAEDSRLWQASQIWCLSCSFPWVKRAYRSAREPLQAPPRAPNLCTRLCVQISEQTWLAGTSIGVIRRTLWNGTNGNVPFTPGKTLPVFSAALKQYKMFAQQHPIVLQRAMQAVADKH